MADFREWVLAHLASKANRRTYELIMYSDAEGWVRRGPYARLRDALFDVMEVEAGNIRALEDELASVQSPDFDADLWWEEAPAPSGGIPKWLEQVAARFRGTPVLATYTGAPFETGQCLLALHDRAVRKTKPRPRAKATGSRRKVSRRKLRA